MISLKNVSKFYYSKGTVASGFSKINLDFNIGEFVAITGESGSGKSTLLNVISGLDSYEEGEMYVDGLETSHYTDKEWEDYRRKNIGNIFQNFNLINSYTVYQNIELVLLLNGKSKKDIKKHVIELIRIVDLYKYRNTKVSKLSGGQKQRVAIARSLAKDTPIIIADEPTGNLDKRSADSIFKLLNKIAQNKLVIVVTHNYEQVSDYVTRKITMHDGRVIEDKKLKDCNECDKVNKSTYNNIIIFNKIRLGIRNTFNIKTKFLLLFSVFLFMILSFFIEYSFFKKQEYKASIDGYNNYFRDKSENRIVINKKDKSSISSSDFELINKVVNIKTIIKNDLLIDQSVELNDNDNYWLYGNINSISLFEGKIDIGRMPETDNEIIVEGSKDQYYLSEMYSEIMNGEFKLYNTNTGLNDSTMSFKIVGIKYIDTIDSYNDYKFYFSEEAYNKMNFNINQDYSTTKLSFMNKELANDTYSVIINDNVPVGYTYISSDLNYLCKYNNCINDDFTISVKNIYYEDSITLKVGKSYSEYTIKNMLNLDKYKISDYQYSYNNKIYVNSSDYNKLYNKDTYQSSVYVKDVENIDETKKELNKLGYNTLLIKDTLVKEGIYQIMKIFKTVVTCVLLFTMFFISYFIIKIILKSRKNYYSIIRMLGGNVKTIKHLLIIELFNIANLVYLFVLLFIYLNNINVINIGFLNTILDYFKVFDYIFLYLVITIMSYLISIKFSRQLFKSSAMKTFMEDK